MAPSPIPTLVIIVCVLAFEGLLFGEELAQEAFPNLNEPLITNETDCDGFFDGFVCGINNAINFAANTFRVIAGVIAFFFGLITFNVPGAPLYVRFVVGTILGASLIWSLATLFRGN